MLIHPTAVIDPAAEIDSSATVGPFCIIGPDVKIGAETKLLGHVVVSNHTTIGERNTIYYGASIGSAPQDLKFSGEPSRLTIGDDNTIRESVTMNIGTESGGMCTTVGNGCLFMAYSHVAHDCQVGDQVILANSSALAGHVNVGNQVILGGMAGVHQFCRIGHNAFLAGGALVAQDVPPFCIAQGDRAVLVGINLIGMKRCGWDRERLAGIRYAFKALFQSDKTRQQALSDTAEEYANNADVREVITFIQEAKRGVCKAKIVIPSDD